MRLGRIAGALLSLAVAAGCGRGEEPVGPPPAEVIVATARVGTIPDTRDYVGNVRAVNSVDVRARVRGYLMAKSFEEGALVAEGDPLYRIDPRDYAARLDGVTPDRVVGDLLEGVDELEREAPAIIAGKGA